MVHGVKNATIARPQVSFETMVRSMAHTIRRPRCYENDKPSIAS